jgi:SpoVK/Ycf46/Vps4 family AAA+-type ATPase
MSIGAFTVDSKTTDRDLKMCIKRLPSKTILVIEDIDSLFVNRKAATSELTYSGVLNAIDGVNRITDTIIFVTTNHIDQIDSAFKRRIDYFVKFDFCTKEQVKDIFQRFNPDLDFASVWDVCKNIKVTPSILQKFLIRELPLSELSEFAKGEHGLESLPDMYT